MSDNAVRLRFTNTAILTILLVLTLTGLYGLMWPMPGWMFDLHRISAWGLVALLPWKFLIAAVSLKRRTSRFFTKALSILLAVWAIFVFALALYWTWQAGPEQLWWYTAAISWHWYLALSLLVPFGIHVWQKWPRPRRNDLFSRRAALKVMGVGAASFALWGLSEAISAFRADPSRPIRSTGSRESGSFTGLNFPVTMMVGEGKTRLEPANWVLQVHGPAVRRPLSLSYDAVMSRKAVERIATLDCTNGWFTTQVWRGLSLEDLMLEAGVKQSHKAVILRAVSGYSAYLLPQEARDTLLGTHVGDQVFDHWHGFPLRAVVPSRRGWQWVKWLVEIEII